MLLDGNPFWDYAAYNVPNYVISLLMYVLFGRFILSLFVRPDWPNYIWRSFRRLTDWYLVFIAAITPKFVLPVFLPLVGAFWLFVLRVVFFFVMYNLGMTPKVMVTP